MGGRMKIPAILTTYLAKFLILGGVYALVIYGGLLLTPHGNAGISAVWIPSAVGLSRLFLFGLDLWPALALPMFLMLVTRGITPPMALGDTVAQVLSSATGAYLLTRLNFRPNLARLWDSMCLIGIAFAVSTIAATIISGMSYALNPAPPIDTTLWSKLWLGSTVSVLVFGPFCFYWGNRPLFTKTSREIVEGVVLFVSIAIISVLIFWTPLSSLGPVSLIYVLIIPLVWASVRSGPRGISLALAMLGLIAATGLLYGHSPLATQPDQQQTLLSLQILIGVLSIIFLPFTSITEERKDAVISLNDHVVELEQALTKISSEDQAKSDFIGMLAHELRNPLSPILSSLELLKQAGLHDNQPSYVQSIASHVHMMARLLDDMLDISRITQKKFKLQVEPVEFKSVLDQTLEIVQPLIDARGHDLAVEVPQTPVWLNGDPVRLTQVFVNLLTNAAKYTNPGGHIKLTSTVEGSELVVRVADNGIGIEPERLSHVFEPFGGAMTPGRGPGGLHVGLSIAKRMVELHHGSIVAHSQVGVGSQFVVRLPVPLATPLPLASGKRERRRFSAQRSAKMHILVVDDNEPAADALAKLLAGNGHEVMVAYDGPGALAKAAHTQPQAAILDIGLPGMDGYELGARMRQRYGSSVVLVALTGFGQREDQEKALQAGFDEHLVKPVSISDIERVLEDLRS